jgi:hypothetical protein
MHLERSDLLERPEFWASRYSRLLKTTQEDIHTLIEPFFEVTNAQCDSFWKRILPVASFWDNQLSAEEQDNPWPCFDFSFPEGFVLRAKRENWGDRYLYYLVHPDWSEELFLGHDTASDLSKDTLTRWCV